MRKEKDALGELEVPEHVYYGIQAERARRNFAVSGHTIDELPVFIRSIAEIKKAAAVANCRIGALGKDISQVICQAADEVIAGKMAGQFPIDILQGGGSTSTNMNVNEVIAHRASELLTGDRSGKAVHPNTHVNMGQSTNDVIPAAIALSCYRYAQELDKSLRGMEAVLAKKTAQFKNVVKVSRTCIQDAVPITLGQEFSGYHAFICRHIALLRQMILDAPLELPLGATASGTGLGVLPGYLREVYEALAKTTGISVKLKENLFDGLQNGDGYVRLSAYLKSLATGLGKIARDLRLMSSGPRAGFKEIFLPAVQPGSSIMPGKINPVMPELMNQVCYQVCGNDTAVTMAAEGGELDLNVWEPVIIKNLTEAFTILTASIPLFVSLCIEDLRPNEEKCRHDAEATLANTTVISALFGYETGSKVAKYAYENGKSAGESAVAMGILSEEEAGRLLDPLMLTDVEKSSAVIGKRRGGEKSLA